MNNVQGTLANGAVKSVQHGRVVEFTVPWKQSKTIPISKVNPQKAFLILDRQDAYAIIAEEIYVAIAESGEGISVSNVDVSNNNVVITTQWQVIEFY